MIVFAVKNTIIFFTGTGNSLAVARLLAKKLPETTVISVNEMLRRSLFALETDTCGFVFPVYCQNAPEIVRRLIRRMEFPARTYLFAIATHNGDPGHSHFTVDKLLRKKGNHLQAGFAVLMPGNSITPYDSTSSEEEGLRRMRAAVTSIDEIADNVIRRMASPYAGSGAMRKRLKGFRNAFRHKFVFKVPEMFWATNACDRCGLCVRICPENNIRLMTGLPEWGKHCQMCLACIHWCPQRAIQNGRDTMGRKRYHHPDITVDDMPLNK